MGFVQQHTLFIYFIFYPSYSELPSWACDISWVLINQSGCPHHHMVAPLYGANSASGAIFRTTKYTVYVNEITKQSSFWRRQALISSPCDQHFSDSHQNPVGFTPKACFFAEKYMITQIPYIPWDFVTFPWDLEIMLHFWRLTEIPWDLAGMHTVDVCQY